jgi:integrase/recombinase XerD
MRNLPWNAAKPVAPARFAIRGADTVTTKLALQWATLPGRSRAWQAQRLSAVRGFARWLHATDPQAQVPPAGLLRGRTRRAVPYLYSEADITALIEASVS